MRIDSLHLDAFGPFTKTRFDLSAGTQGLHVIFGANEAGKSSALRAIDALLWGFPSGGRDAFLHSETKLRVGAVLRNRAGETLEALRRKRGPKTLLAADEKTVVDDAAWKAMLAGLDADTFRQLFAIDLPRLELGGKEIVEGKGDTGKLLVSAAGVANLQQVQSKLIDEYRGLFLPRGRDGVPLNRLFGERTRQTKTANDLQLKLKDWRDADGEFTRACQRKDELAAELAELERTTARRRRLLDALPLARRREELRAALARHAETPDLPADFSRQRQSAQQAHRVAVAERESLTLEIARLEKEAVGRKPPLDLLARQPQIERLYRTLGEMEKSDSDEKGLIQREHQSNAKVREILRRLNRPVDLFDKSASLIVSVQDEIAIDELGRQHSELSARLDSASQRLNEVELEMAECRAKIASVGPTDGAEALLRDADDASKLGDIDGEIASLERDANDTQAEIVQWTRRAGVNASTPDEAAALPSPSIEAVEHFASAQTELRARAESLRKKLDELRQRERVLQTQVEQLDGGGSAPSESSLEESRALRDRTWSAVRQAWDKGEHPPPPAFLAPLKKSTLADAFEQTLADADALSDRLRREADRVQQRAAWQTELQRIADDASQTATELGRTEADQRSLKADWEAAWRATGVTPTTAAEARSWLRERQTILARVQSLRETLRRRDDLVEKRDRAIERLRPTSAGTTTQATRMGPLLESARKRRDAFREAQAWSERLDQATRRKHEAEHERMGAEQRLEKWRGEWSARMAALALPSEATPAQASGVLAELRELHKERREADGYRARIGGIERDRKKFHAEAAQLADALSMGGISDPARAVMEIWKRLTQAQADQKLDADKRRSLEEKQTRLEVVSAEIRKQEAVLATLRQQARAASDDEIAAVEERSREKAVLVDKLSHVDNDLQRLRGDRSLDAFLQDVLAVRVEDTEAELAKDDAERASLSEELETVHQRIGALRSDLGRMKGAADAADAAQRAEEISAEIENTARRYFSLRLASGVLQEAIERYRKKNEGLVLRRAGAGFAKLTCGAFSDIAVEPGADGSTVIVGVRASSGKSERVPVEEMSDGTRNQLYLALRLASVELYLDSHEPAPFIVDDLLLHFDDHRASAALDALSDLSTRTQVLFFTHHQHLVDLAKNRVAKDRLFVHAIDR